MRCEGNSFSVIIDWLVSTGTWSSPSIFGIVGRPPTLTKMRSAESASPFTATVCGPVKRAWPRYTLADFSIHFSMPLLDLATTASLRAITAARSIVGSPASFTP